MPGLDPGIHVLLSRGIKTWMAGTSPAMTDRLIARRKPSTNVPSSDLHGHAGFRGADAVGTGGARPRDRGRLHPRGKTRRTRHEAAIEPGGAGGAAAQGSRPDAQDVEVGGRACGFSRP